MSVTTRESCNVCLSKDLKHVLDLGNHPNADSFLIKPISIAVTPLILEQCQACGHGQLKHNTSKLARYCDIDYSYTSSNSKISRKHFEELASYIASILCKSPSITLEPGSNDGTLLRAISKHYPNTKLVGVDPSSISDEQENSDAIINRIHAFFDKENTLDYQDQVELIVATNVLNHADSPREFFRNCRFLMSSEGLLIIEVPDLKSMVNGVHFETIYHEHINYFTAHSLRLLAKQSGMKMIDLSLNEYMCGSLRAAFALEESASHHSRKEITYKDFNSIDTWRIPELFSKRCKDFKKNFCSIFHEPQMHSCLTVGLGASTKANTLLNFCGISTREISFLTDVSPNKIGKYTPGSKIPIIHPSEISKYRQEVDFVVGLPLTTNINALLEKEAECYNFQLRQLPSR